MASLALSAALLLVDLAAGTANGAPVRTNRDAYEQVSSVRCSSGYTFDLDVKWSLGNGATISRIDVNGKKIDIQSNHAILNPLKEATDLRHVEAWCSGADHGGVRIHVIQRVNGKPTPLIVNYEVDLTKVTFLGLSPDSL